MEFYLPWFPNRLPPYSRSILRDDHEKEVRLLFERQRSAGNRLASEDLEHRFIAIAFFQRPLADSWDKVAWCAFEPEHRRAAKHSPSFELFRFLSRLSEAAGAFGPSDHLFFREFGNRDYAQRILQDQFNQLMKQTGLRRDPEFGGNRTVYSLRHTAICMRLVLSGGKVNIFNLAKNAGTSVDQIERFYAKNLPMSAELARNLQVASNG